MLDPYAWQDVRRIAPRVQIAASCLEVGEKEREGLLIDLSPRGARLEQPYVGGATPDEVYLEMIIPELGEIVVAKGEPCFDHVRPSTVRTGPAGPFGLIRRTGYRIVAAASRDLRLLREFVMELRRTQRAELGICDELMASSCYARG
jgi:hypothetical protein